MSGVSSVPPAAHGGGAQPTIYGESRDQDEEFEDLQNEMVLSQHPDALPFFKASKVAVKGGRSSATNIRAAKPRPFQ